ncbi:hypothetical protein BH18VER1_BH18VER1_05490 [soil metagenome]
MIRPFDNSDAEEARVVEAEIEQYCRKHPLSPAAKKRPRVMLRGHTCVALLGSTLEEGVAGIGANVAAALHAFDIEYLNSQRGRRP